MTELQQCLLKLSRSLGEIEATQRGFYRGGGGDRLFHREQMAAVQHHDPAGMTRALMSIVHEGATATAAAGLIRAA